MKYIKTLLLGLVLSIVAFSADAAIAIGQKILGQSTFTGAFTTTGITTSASASSFVVAVTMGTGRTAAVTDNKGNPTYTQIGTLQNTTAGGTDTAIGVYICVNCTGGATHTFTVTLTGGSSYMTVFGIEITGGATSGIVDVISQNQDATTPFVGTAITPTTGNRLLLGFLGSPGGSSSMAHTSGNSFTIVSGLDVTSDSVSWPQVVAQRSVTGDSSTPYNTTFTEANNTLGVGLFTISLKELSAPPAGNSRGMFLIF